MKILLVNSPSWSLKGWLLPSLLGLLVVLLLISCNGGEQVAGGSSSTETGAISLSGRVIDNTDAPVSGVIVTLAKAGISDTTDSLGKYRIQRSALAKESALASTQGILDTLIFKQNGQVITTQGVTNLVDSFPDLKIVQRNISGNFLSGSEQIGNVEGVLSGNGIPAGQPLVATFFYNKLSNNYSGFLYFSISDSVQKFSVYVKVFDTTGHFTGESQTVPFNSQAGDITVPTFNPTNAIPKANAGKDTTVDLNEMLTLHGTAVDSFGTIVKWEWDIGGTGVFNTTSTGDTTFLVSPQSPRSFVCVLRVTDNYGNTNTDTLVISISSAPPATPIVAVNSSSLTSTNKAPTWSWSSGGGGDGTFRYKLDDPNLSTGATQTIALSFTPGANLIGSHTLYVQETDVNENWSTTGNASVVIIDTTSQTLAAAGWGVNGVLLQTANGGINWTPQSIDTTIHLGSVFFADANNGWSPGGNGSGDFILKTTNGGTSWTSQTGMTAKAVGLGSIYFVDSKTGWVVGGSGTILKTIDGGVNWTAQTDSVFFGTLNSVFFVNANMGWAAGNSGTILNTTDGGINWKTQVSSSTPGSSFIPGSLYSIHFVDENNGWAVGSNGTVFNTKDGGAHWVIQTSGILTANALYSVYFVDANTGWASGASSAGGVIANTINGGSTWTIQLNGGVATKTVRSLYFVDANTGWAVGEGGIVLKTSNGGTSWTVQTSGTTNNLLSISPIP